MSFTSFVFLISFWSFSTSTPEIQPSPQRGGISLKTDTAFQNKLFDDEEVLRFKLSGRLWDLFNDRNENGKYYPLLLQYASGDSVLSVPLKGRVRGNFRRQKENCLLPPVLLNFQKSRTLPLSIFNGQDKLKLVMPCRGDEYVVREYLVYKLYNLVSQNSFKARLVQVQFEDSLKKHRTETHYGILLEDEGSVARRNHLTVGSKKLVAMESTDGKAFIKTALFEYMIGNTDWSVEYLHNIKLMYKAPSAPPYAVPYDFDHAGIVSTPYALPAEELELGSVRDRLYRGYCIQNKADIKEAVQFFNGIKNEVYRVYESSPLLNDKYKKWVTRYLDDFYRTINNEKRIEDEFSKPCYARNRVVIKGLNK